MSNGRPPRQPSSPTNGLEDEESGNVMYQSGNNAAEEIHSQTFRSPELRSILSVPSFRASAIRQLSRSHYSSRSDSESGSEILGSIPTRSAQEIRQQTMSYTFRDLSMSQSSRLGNPISDDKSSISSPVIAVDFLSSNDQPEQNTSLEIQKNPIDPTTFGLSVPHGRNVSQLSELRRAMSTSSSSNSPPHPEQTAALNSDHTTGDTITDSSQSNSHSNKSHASSSAFHMKLNDVRFPDEDDTDTEETTMLLKGYREDLSGDELQVTTGYDRVGNSVTWYGSVDVDRNRKQAPTTFRSILKHTQRDIPTITPALLLEIGANGLRSIPAVILGLILNILDAMSYGIIVFPQSDPLMPSSATQSGISMFFASTVIAQLVYTFGGSKFKGANGSMMIEVMPFLHIMCRIIEEKVGGNNQKTLMATIMVAYSLSTLMTGLVFLLLGVFKLGNVIQFFPRHILVGCIGGIGLFLIETGIEVSTGLKTEFTFEYLKQIFSLQYLPLWGSGALLAVFLKIMQRYISHPLFVPSFYVIVPLFFYAVVWFIGVSLDDLRKNGWLFDLPSSSEVPYYTFWTYFDFNHVDWSAIPATLPTILALTFFGILHVPINVPALAVSTQQEVDTNLEIVGHGISNIAAGLIGTVQNYLVYANSLLYIRSGGNTRIGGFLLAIATAVVWIVGGSVVSLVPTMVVGSLIFLLGIDLMKESIVDTLHVGIHFLE
ncbi:hypothetical protein HK098_000168 [Nowakowskiella sp. JEL0407]|nr:hypothetical protein HK098_000168 [Nowakowskiella sp. JEL0407]